MLRVNLGQLSREGSVDVTGTLPRDDPMWRDSDLAWSDDVRVDLSVSVAGTGEIVARGRAGGTLDQECRRCLRPLNGEVDEELTLVFIAREGPEGDEGDEYPFDPSSSEIDLGDAVRQELILAIDPYVECGPDCRGLCARCGANLNEEACACTEDENDPRWEALRALKDE